MTTLKYAQRAHITHHRMLSISIVIARFLAHLFDHSKSCFSIFEWFVVCSAQIYVKCKYANVFNASLTIHRARSTLWAHKS